MSTAPRLHFGPGTGIVAAFDDAVLLVLAETPPERLLDLVRTRSDGDRSGRGLARRLARLLTSEDADSVPPFGLAAEDDDGLVVFLSGAVAATAAHADGSETNLSGADAATWVDRVLPADVGTVTIHPDGAAPGPTDPPFELSRGVAPGGWLRLTREPAGTTTSDDDASATPAPAPPPSEPASGQAAAPDASGSHSPDENVTEPEEQDDDPPTGPIPEAFDAVDLTPDSSTLREPLPVDDGDQAPAEDGADDTAAPGGELVDGILCSRQHFNHPEAAYCSTCGISMVHRTHNLVTRERPPLGFIVFDDGATFTLDDQYVLGRRPTSDELVEREEARPIVLEDPGRSISRSHAEVRLVGWDVQLVDRESRNGTHVWDPDAGSWDRLEPGRPRVIEPGDRVAVGQRTFVYESPHADS